MENKDQALLPEERIEGRIYLVRGIKVMFDVDLAVLYEVNVKVLNQAVDRHAERFPEDFCFEIPLEQAQNLKSQIVTSSYGGRRKPHRVFTEQGIAMLSSVLRSPRAIAVNIQIIRTFTKLREMVKDNEQLRLKLEAMEKRYDQQFSVVFEAIRRLLDEPPSKGVEIGYELQ